jgi:regulator of PEP synthase PpsR (kinase-PPPase family)
VSRWGGGTPLKRPGEVKDKFVLTIMIVSDATGRTAEQVVRAGLAQFEDAQADVICRGGIRSRRKLSMVLKEAAQQQALVFHTLISPELRREMLEHSHRLQVDAMDLIGPVVERLAVRTGRRPDATPGFFKQFVESKKRKISAVDFTFRHDDGQHAADITEAEVVLVGASRTMKTPTALYLAYRGWFVSNVPLIAEIPPFPELLSLPPERVFCLTMDAGRLAEIRRARAASSRFPEKPYAGIRAVQRDVKYAKSLCAKHGWTEIDVSGKSVEEVAGEIVGLLQAEGAKAEPRRRRRKA